MSNTLWYNSALNTNKLSGVFNQLYNKKAIQMVRTANALFYAITGQQWADGGLAGDQSGASFERLNRITGNQIEVRLLGVLDDFSGAYVTDGASEIATATPAYSANMYGGNTFDWAHIAQTKAIPSTEYNMIAGNEAKTLSWVDDTFTQLVLSLEKEIGQKINAANAPARSAIGGWPYAVDDGTTYATYGGIDRSQSANANYRSYVDASGGALTLKKIRATKNQVRVNGGNNKLGVAGLTVYNKVQDLTEAYTEIESDPEWTQLGGEYVQYGGTRFLLEQYAPAATLGLLDPRSFAYWENKIGLQMGQFQKAPHLVAAYVMPWEYYGQLICLRPSSNGKITGLDA